VGPASNRILLPGALFVLALGVRALDWPTVFTAQGVLFPEPDAYYHLRRIAYSIARFPAVLETDSYINFPEGAKPIWTPVFDWLVALALRATPAAADEAAMERAVAWVPPLLGALCVVALYALARRHFGAPVAIGAGILLAVLPGNVWYSQLGSSSPRGCLLASVLVLWPHGRAAERCAVHALARPRSGRCRGRAARPRSSEPRCCAPVATPAATCRGARLPLAPRSAGCSFAAPLASAPRAAPEPLPVPSRFQPVGLAAGAPVAPRGA
jgi:hypothetical protein